MSRIARFNLGLEDDDQDFGYRDTDSDFDDSDSLSSEDLLVDDTDTFQRKIELADGQNEDRAAAIAEQLTADAIDGLTEVREFVSETDSSQAMPYVEIAVESYLRPFDLKSDQAGVSMESNGDVTVSLEKLDSFIDQLKGGKARLRARRASMESIDTDDAQGDIEAITDDNDYQFSIAAAKAAELSDQTERASNAAIDAQVVQMMAEEQDENGDFGLEAYRGALIALQACRRAAGIRGKIDLNPSTVSMEFLDEERLSLLGMQKDLFKRLIATIGRANALGFIQSFWYRHKLGKLIGELNKRSFSGGGTVHVNVNYLHEDGAIPSDLAGYLRQYADFSKKIFEGFHVNAKNAFEDNIAAAKIAAKSGSLTGIASKWKDPRSRLTGRKLTASIPGGRYLFVDRPLMWPDATDPDVKYLDRFANLAYPTIVFYREKTTGLKTASVPVMSSDQLLKVADGMFSAIASVDKLQAYVEQAAASLKPIPLVVLINTFRRSRGNNITVSGQSRVSPGMETKILRAALYTSNRMRFHVSFDAVLSFTRTVSNFLGYAKACMRASQQ